MFDLIFWQELKEELKKEQIMNNFYQNLVSQIPSHNIRFVENSLSHGFIPHIILSFVYTKSQLPKSFISTFILCVNFFHKMIYIVDSANLEKNLYVM